LTPVSQDHYFSTEPATPSRPATARLILPDRTLELATDRGVFAHRHIDRGTEILLRTIPAPPGGALLDLGCGYGAIAVTVALRASDATVWAVDINRRALELCRLNASTAGAKNVIAAEPDDVPDDQRFAAIYSNPPVHSGKETLHVMLDTWLRRLQPGGHAYLVVQRHLGSDTLALWLTEQGYRVDRLRSRTGYRVFDIHANAKTRQDESS
jgi:16S rRNA (guanine1207-N2)-methyltransferase